MGWEGEGLEEGREGGRRKVKEELRLGGGAPKSKKAEVTLSLVLAVGGLAALPLEFQLLHSSIEITIS